MRERAVDARSGVSQRAADKRVMLRALRRFIGNKPQHGLLGMMVAPRSKGSESSRSR